MTNDVFTEEWDKRFTIYQQVKLMKDFLSELDVKQLQADVVSLKSKCDELLNDVTNINVSISNLEERLNGFNLEINNLKARVNTAEGNISTLTSDLEPIKNTYVNNYSNQTIKGIKQFNDGITFKRHETGVSGTPEGNNVLIKSFGRQIFFKGIGGVGDSYTYNAEIQFTNSGAGKSNTYIFPNKSGIVALTSDLEAIKEQLATLQAELDKLKK